MLADLFFEEQEVADDLLMKGLVLVFGTVEKKKWVYEKWDVVDKADIEGPVLFDSTWVHVKYVGEV